MKISHKKRRENVSVNMFQVMCNIVLELITGGFVGGFVGHFFDSLLGYKLFCTLTCAFFGFLGGIMNARKL